MTEGKSRPRQFRNLFIGQIEKNARARTYEESKKIMSDDRLE